MKKSPEPSALCELLKGIDQEEGLQSLHQYTPNRLKIDYLLSLDLDKIKKDFANTSVGLVDFVEIMFTQLFNLSKYKTNINPKQLTKNIYLLFRD